LTHKTPISLNIDLLDIFHQTDAKYKMLWKDRFVFFSPETFVTIVDDCISTFPMKGTIDASVPKAKTRILMDEKEIAEHYTIVDLLRNDLSRVAKNVTVEKFRYLDKIKAGDKKLIQVSSEIVGRMQKGWQQDLGTILEKLLPAGSISGAPKKKTIQIIQDAELQDRGYYTGICGLFDGKNLDTGVCIRFIEREGEQYFFRSGCGITAQSSSTLEYQEMIQKIYIPISKV
jgi:para-aminobenzoate synthetase component 1